jgi:ComF family protein
MGVSPLRTAASWGNRALYLLLPPACAACRGPLPSRSGTSAAAPRICPNCLARLREPPHPRCKRCGAPRGTGLPEDRPCNECRDWPDALVAAASATVLASPSDELVHALKYGGWPGLAADLGARMARLLPSLAPRGEEALVVPVPTTPGRLRVRGYNQARLLAEEVAHRSGMTLVDALERRDGGRSQVALHPDERRANVEGAFSVRPEARSLIRNASLILVDDVLTTGATASAAARSLGEGGAAAIRLLTFARALPGAE